MFIAHPEGLEPLLGRKSPEFETINVFKDLMDYLEHAPENQRVDALLADFSAKVGRLKHKKLCVGMLTPNYKMIEAIMLFRPYGIAFSFYTRKSDKETVITAHAREVVQTREEQLDAHEASYSRLTVKRPALAVAA
jgi:hypothetical protein